MTRMLLLVVLLVGPSTAFPHVPGPAKNESFHELMVEFFDKIKQIMTNLDPFYYSFLRLDTDTKMLRLLGSIEPLIISGSSGLQVSGLKASQKNSTLNLEVGLFLPKIQITGTYDLDFNIMTFFAIYGQGQMGIMLNGVGVSVKISCSYQPPDGLLKMNSFDFDYSFSNMTSQLDGLVSPGVLSDFLNEVASDVGALVVGKARPLLRAAVPPILEASLDNFIRSHNFTVGDLLRFLDGFVHS